MKFPRIICADSLELLRKLPDDSISWCVTDPPYGLNPDLDVRKMLAAWLLGREYKPKGKGFMGKGWDATLPPPIFWAELLRVLKPGAHACVFSAPRNQDLMGISLRLAGFEIRDCLDWLYGTGFPKSRNVSKDLAESGSPEAEQWEGWGSALKPAREPIFLIRKPLAKGYTLAENVLEYGTGAINVGACAIVTTEKRAAVFGGSKGGGGVYGYSKKYLSTPNEAGRFPPNVILDEEAAALLDAQSGKRPVSGQARKGVVHKAGKNGQSMFSGLDRGNDPGRVLPNDSGGASRFFYVAKASAAEKELGCEHLEPKRRTDGRETDIENPRLRTSSKRNHHPTIKPIKLIRYLIRLVAPPSSRGIDPFLGSGTAAIAALREGVDLVGVESDPEYVEIAEARLAACAARKKGVMR